MNRQQLEQAIRAACDVAGDSEVYVIGSQAILGQYPNAPETLLSSIEADIIPKHKPEAWNAIDGALGEGSQFHDSHNFYVQGLELATAKLVPGWQKRCIQVKTSRGTIGHCLEANDLALSKLAAFREKDRDFVRTLLVEGLAQTEVLLDRLPRLPVDDPRRTLLIEDWIRAIQVDLDPT